MTGFAYGYPAAWVYAAGRGWMAGRFGTEDLYEHPYYRSLSPFAPERYVFRVQFTRGRETLEDRVSRGAENAPGSVYDPALDDGRGALWGVDPRGE